MKKVLLFAGVVGMLAFTSCSKKSDYNCECSVAGGSTSVDGVFKDIKEDDAEKACDQLEIFAGETCTIKEI